MLSPSRAATHVDLTGRGEKGDRAINTSELQAVPPGILSTVGYAHREGPATVERLMQQESILLLDIRLRPRSRWFPAWNRKALSAKYGPCYQWGGRLGNVNYNHRELGIQLAEGHEQAVREAATLLHQGTSLLLLCACSDPSTCHRTLVAHLIHKALDETQVLQDEATIYPDFASAQEVLDRGERVRIHMQPFPIDPHLLQFAQDFQDKAHLAEAMRRLLAGEELEP